MSSAICLPCWPGVSRIAAHSEWRVTFRPNFLSKGWKSLYEYESPLPKLPETAQRGPADGPVPGMPH